jgi:hypothetical protein
MKIMGHREIRRDWHQITTEDGVFFGYSEQQAREKADAYRRRTLIALAERHNFLQLMARQRGVRII